MLANMSALYGQLKDDLQKMEAGAFSPLIKADACFRLTALYFTELKLMVDAHRFSEADEITLYKYIAPAFFEEILYYMAVIDLESQEGSPEAIRCYCMVEMEEIRSYLQRQDHLRQYMAGGKAYLDDILFRHRPSGFEVFPDHLGFEGTEHFNPHSYLIAKIAAYLRLYPFIEHRLATGLAKTAPELYRQPRLPETAPAIPAALLQLVIEDIAQKVSWLKAKVAPCIRDQQRFLLLARLKYSSALFSR